MVNLTKKFIEDIKFDGKDKTYWDNILPCFGLRVREATKTFIIKYRNINGVQRKMKIGKATDLPPEEARKIAKDRLAEATKGFDPAEEKIENRRSMSIADLCDLYLLEGVHNKKPSTIMNDKSRIERHIKPLIGSLSLKSLNTGIIEKMMLSIIQGKTAVCKKSENKRGVINVKGGKSIAKRTIEMLGAILEFAKRRKLIENNPAHGIEKPKGSSKDVFLSLDDIKALSKALKQAEATGENKQAINAVKLLILTGCRKNEILSLKWEYIDFKNKCFRFPDTKTGKQIRPFGQGALNLLLELKEQSSSTWIFPASRGEGFLIGLPKIFKRILNLKDKDTKKPFIEKTEASLHTLRHSFASIAADMAYSELTIAGLLGHRLGGVTNRYSHLPDKSLIAAADSISLRIEQALLNKEELGNNVIELKRG